MVGSSGIGIGSGYDLRHGRSHDGTPGLSRASSGATEVAGAYGLPATGSAHTALGVGGTPGVAGAGQVSQIGGEVRAEAVQPTECATCASRRYQDVSSDAGVSFKAPGRIDPSISASAVMAHEQEHVSLAQARADAEGGRIIASVSLKTDICPECGRVYVAGGEARITTIAPVGENARNGDALGVSPEVAVPAAAGAAQHVPRPVMEDGGADLFRRLYKQTMAANFGLFVNARV